jgi:hypothetical protein
MRGIVKTYDPRRGVAEILTKHGTVEARWPAIRRSNFLPDPGETVEIHMANGVVRRLRRIVVAAPGKT